jgi:hypothetical protein
MVAFSQEVFDSICTQIADGKSLRSICAQDGMPTTTSVMRWLKEDDGGELREQYTRAREAQADTIFDEILEIADDGRNDWMEQRGESEGYTLNGEHVQRSRLRIDARKWMAGKLRPKVYGDKLALGGADDLPPIRTESAADLLRAKLDEIASRNTGGA